MLVIGIILLVLLAAVFIASTSFAKYAEKENCDDEAAAAKKVRAIVCTVLAVILVLLCVLSGITMIDSTEVGVVRSFGRIDREIGAGLNWKNPISEKVEKYDLRVHIRDVQFESYTKDAQPVIVTADYQYKLRPGEVMDVAREYGSYEIMESKLKSVVEEKIKTVFSKYSAMPLLENRANLSPEVYAAIEELEELYHVDFTATVVRDIVFSDAFEASVEAKMTAEQEALRAEQEKKTAVVKAEQQKEVAAINAEAAIEQARGEAEAMQITREALQNMPEAYIQQMWIDRWDGKLPSVQAGTQPSLVVNPDIG